MTEIVSRSQSTTSCKASCLESRRAHLVGIAGAGMRALAEVLLGNGRELSGSDRAIDRTLQQALPGVQLYDGHRAEHLPSKTELVVYSDAVPADNSELQRAAELGIPTHSYFETLGRLSAEKYTLAVAGTHGKSTTTAMAAAILVEAGRDPTVLCGAVPLGRTSGGRAGGSNLMLVEACEYRANFLHLHPQLAVITGIEPDHFDYYNSPGQLQTAFGRFAGSIPPDGLLLAGYDCPVTRRIADGLPCRVKTFGIDPGADWSAVGLSARLGRYTFEIYRHGVHVCDINLRVPGRHNVLNALAAALTYENCKDKNNHTECHGRLWHDHLWHGREISRALNNFPGLRRRLELRGTYGGVAVIDDYAHHPTEVAAALQAVRRMFPGRRLWCVFQPHQASRTERLLDELAGSLQNAEKVLVAEIFRAREGTPKRGEVTAADLARAVRRGGTVVPNVHDTEKIVKLLQNSLAPGDILVTMGAGDIENIRLR